MDVEKTIQFLLENQARFDARMEANFAKAEMRFAKAEKRLDRTEGIVAQLAVAGRKFRNEIRQVNLETARNLKELSQRQVETEDKLNALIDFVDKSSRRGNGKGPNGKKG
ncbi:MAG TPA: hypothetical protein VI455_11450 [Terriglobia bacterium]